MPAWESLREAPSSDKLGLFHGRVPERVHMFHVKQAGTSLFHVKHKQWNKR